MRYLGSKLKLAKHILPIILRDRHPGQWYVEPFVGGANIIQFVEGNRIGADINPYMIALFDAMQKGWIPPSEVTKEEYKKIKSNPDQYPDALVGFVGTACSFGGHFLNTYTRGDTKCRNYADAGKRHFLKQKPKLAGVRFIMSHYRDLTIPPRSIIYCDPPYKNARGYGVKFDHEDFLEWCRTKAREGHKVFVSEYNAPPDFVCVWEKDHICTIDIKTVKTVEKLFSIKNNSCQ